MSFTESAGHPLSGNLVLQHKDFIAKNFSLDMRFHKRCVRVVEHFADNGDLGHVKLDQDATGDLVLGLCWPQQQGQRDMPMWSFGFPTIVQSSGRGNVATDGGAGPGSVATPSAGPGGAPGGGGGGGRGGGGGPMEVLPIADKEDGPDVRMKPIQVPVRKLKAKGPENPPPPPGGGGDGRGGDPNQIDYGSDIIYLGIGGGIGGFGGPGVGRGGGFPTFGGVRSNFSSGNSQAGATFGGVRNNFSNGSPRTGAQFSDPTRQRR